MKVLHKISFDYKKILMFSLDISRKFLWVLARDAFLFILVFILIAMVLGEFLFYHYVFLVEVNYPNTNDTVVRFKEDMYKSVIGELKNRENTFNSPWEGSYQDPFIRK